MRLCLTVLAVAACIFSAGCRAPSPVLRGDEVITVYFERNLDAPRAKVKVFFTGEESADEQAVHIADRVFEETMGDVRGTYLRRVSKGGGRYYFEFSYRRPREDRIFLYRMHLDIPDRKAVYSAAR